MAKKATADLVSVKAKKCELFGFFIFKYSGHAGFLKKCLKYEIPQNSLSQKGLCLKVFYCLCF